MTDESWQAFSDEIDKRTSKSISFNNPIENHEHLNKQWHTWNNIIKRTANEYIPFTFSLPRKFHAHTLTMTKLLQALKISFKLIDNITNLRTPLHHYFIIYALNLFN